MNQKHHPPRWEDEVWRLEGIAKDGIYHKNLSSKGIRTVGDFLKAYHQNDPDTLRMVPYNKTIPNFFLSFVDSILNVCAFSCIHV